MRAGREARREPEVGLPFAGSIALFARPGHGQGGHAEAIHFRPQIVPGESFARAEVEAHVFVLREPSSSESCPDESRAREIARTLADLHASGIEATYHT